jgi:glycosyltransferase involved in cell wall biosynthesis
MKSKRVLFYYPSGSLGGQQMQIYNIGKEMHKVGFEVYWAVDVPGYFSDLLEKSGGHIIRINSGSDAVFFQKGRKFYLYRIFLLIMKFYRLRKVVRESRSDVVILSDSFSTFMTFFPTKPRDLKVFRLIGADILAYEVFFKYYKLLRIDRYVNFYLGFDKAYNDLLSIGVSNLKFVNFSSNAVDTNLFFPRSVELNEAFKLELKISPDKIVIGWVGRIEQINQSMNTLLLGRELLNLGFKDFVLLFVGGGEFIYGIESVEYLNYFKDKAITFGLGPHTLFTGWVDYKKVNNYLNVMDIVPMLESDPSGGSILREAMSCGKVALSVDGPSHIQKDFMKDDNSVLVGSSDFLYLAAMEIISLAKDKDRQKRIGENARKYCVNSMSFEVQAREIIACF